MGETVSLQAADGSGNFNAYVAKAQDADAPSIVVIQEIFGVNANIRGTCDRLASEGFHAIAPDMFWRQEVGVELTESEFEKAVSLLNGFNREKGLEDIETTITYARSLSASGKVGVNGYCMGGFLAYVSAALTSADASVGYYGVRINTVLDLADKIKTPLMLHIAVKDGHVPPDAQAEMHAGLDGHPLFTLHDYADADHAFARLGGSAFREEDATLANMRSTEFFKTHLKG